MFKKKHSKVVIYPICRDCKFWKHSKEESFRPGSDLDIRMGICSCVDVTDFVWMRGHGDDEIEEDLVTHASFGCRSWEDGNGCSKS